MPFHSLLKVRRVHDSRTQERVDPLLLGESASSLKQFRQVHILHLNWLQLSQHEGRSILILLEEIFQSDQAPDAADEKFLELLDGGTGNFNSTYTQVAEQRS